MFIDCAEWAGNYSFNQVTTFAPDGRHFLPAYSLRIAEKLVGYLIAPTSVYTPSITETTYSANLFNNIHENVVMENMILRTYGSLATMSVWLHTTGNVTKGNILAQMNLTLFDPSALLTFGNINSFSGAEGASITIDALNGNMYLLNSDLGVVGSSVFQFVFPISNSTFTTIRQQNM